MNDGNYTRSSSSSSSSGSTSSSSGSKAVGYDYDKRFRKTKKNWQMVKRQNNDSDTDTTDREEDSNDIDIETEVKKIEIKYRTRSKSSMAKREQVLQLQRAKATKIHEVVASEKQTEKPIIVEQTETKQFGQVGDFYTEEEKAKNPILRQAGKILKEASEESNLRMKVKTMSDMQEELAVSLFVCMYHLCSRVCFVSVCVY